MMERVFKFLHEGKEYRSYDPIDLAALDRAARWCVERATRNIPDAASEVSQCGSVEGAEENTAMEAQTEVVAKKPAKTTKVTGAGPTAFSTFCKANKIDGVKARRALRAAGMRRPYDPKSKKVLDVLKAL